MTDTDTDTDAGGTMVTAEDAARIIGVSPRTVRRWIRNGELPNVESPEGRRVSLADLAALRRQPRSRSTGDTDGHGHGHPASAVTDTPASVTPAARSQLEAIRDEWLAPLVAQIREQAQHIGRLEERLAATEQERDRVAGRLSTDRVLTDLLVETLQHERDAAVRAVVNLRQEIVALQTSRDAATRALVDGAGLPSGPGARPLPPSDTPRTDSARPGATGGAVSGAETHRSSILVSVWRRLFGRG